jgi:hypothetical protein
MTIEVSGNTSMVEARTRDEGAGLNSTPSSGVSSYRDLWR